jgi:hypothetical protein
VPNFGTARKSLQVHAESSETFANAGERNRRALKTAEKILPFDFKMHAKRGGVVFEVLFE